MREIKSVCVYCASQDGNHPAYKEVATQLGKILAENGIRIVYGGGTFGLMGAIADSAVENGGEVVGVIPQDLIDKEGQHDHLTELHVVKNMHKRKMRMIKESDAFVILPGGLGTRDEFFEILTWRKLGFHDMPVIFLNVNDYWRYLKEDIKLGVEEGFISEKQKNFFVFTEEVEEVLPQLRESPVPEVEKRYEGGPDEAE